VGILALHDGEDVNTRLTGGTPEHSAADREI